MFSLRFKNEFKMMRNRLYFMTSNFKLAFN